MMIGIDARMYNEGLGIGRYVSRLIAHLELLETDDHYTIFLTRRQWDSYTPKNSRFTKVCADIPWYSLREQILLPWILYRHRVDLMHFPHFNVPFLYFRPFVMTIHDFIMWKYPNSAQNAVTTHHFVLYRIKYFVYRMLMYWTARRAKKIIAVSQHTANDCRSLLHLAPRQIEVIHEASGITARDELQSVKPERPPYMLSVGNAYPHKNLELLIDAFTDRKDEIQLMICGQNDIFHQKLQLLIKEKGLEERIIHCGYVGDEQLEALYRGAMAFIFPSLEEGFGLPGLEAMERGIPVIASNTGSLPEIFGDAALFFDPLSKKQLQDQITRVANDSALRDDLRRKGFARSQLFRWDLTAQQTSHLYHAIAL
jgi:glycosyltransferase involved in cell wall biosynthesis